MMKGKIVLLPSFSVRRLIGSQDATSGLPDGAIGPHRHVVLAFVTSRIPADLLETDLILDTRHADFALTGVESLLYAPLASSDDGDHLSDSA